LKRSLFLAIAAIALVAVPRVSHAQLGLVKPFSLGVAGGGALPMSDMSDVSKTGYNGTVAMQIKLPFIPLGLRVDGAYNGFSSKVTDGPKLHVLSGTGNLVWNLPSVGVSPYLIGGAGLYMATVSGTGLQSATDNKLGWNTVPGLNQPLTVYHDFDESL
jgi:hypothetical protein